MVQYVKADHLLILDHWISKPSDEWVLRETPNYYLADGNIAYLLDANSSEAEIVKYYRRTDEINCSLQILSKSRIPECVNYKDSISSDACEAMVRNMESFFFGIHDAEGFLIWVKNGHEDLMRMLELNMKDKSLKDYR